jgi:hypothetical protein
MVQNINTAPITLARSNLNLRLAANWAGIPAWEPACDIHRSSSDRSAADCHLFCGSLARHFFTSRSKRGGVKGVMAEIETGSRSIMAAIKVALDVPSKARFPVDIS